MEEEGLLSLSSWPALKELEIWGNPLTTAFSGDPPIIAIQLGVFKGIHIVRLVLGLAPRGASLDGLYSRLHTKGVIFSCWQYIKGSDLNT